MPLSLDQFAQQLTASGLLAADDVAALRAGSTATDGEQFARELIKDKHLTPFQAQQIYAGKGKSLVLGNYVVVDKLGQGGMGLVLKAQHRRMKRTVALKVLSPAVTKTPELRQRFQREVEAAARLTHPNIVAAFDADEVHGTLYFVMEYVEGRDLASIVRAQGPMPVEEAVRCLVQAAHGLEYAHKQGVIHRDIKPANLLLDSNGTVKILDMGLARIEGDVAGRAELTSTGAVMGTVDYMAPEQAVSTKHADARSDIYSLGISLWYLIVGRPAYEGDSLMARMLAHRDAPLPSLIPHLAPGRPRPGEDSTSDESPGPGRPGANYEALDAVFHKMIAKTPAARYQSMTEVIAALESVLRGDAVSAASESEDNPLQTFLRDLNQRQSAPTSPAPFVAIATPAIAAAEEPTLTIASAAAGTDPNALATLAAADARKPWKTAKPIPRWWLDRRVQIASLCVGLLVSVAVWLSPNGGKTQPRTPKPTASTTAPSPERFVLRFDGLTDYVHIPSLTDASLPLTIEAWIKPSLSSSGNIAGVFGADHKACIWGSSQFVGGSVGDLASTRVGRSDVGLPAEKLEHLAGVFDGETASIFLNGRLLNRETLKGDGERMAATPGAYLAGMPESGLWRGDIYAARISRASRYDRDFTPPPELTADEDTVALYLCDSGSGTTLTDASGHDHHGVIHFAEWIKAAPIPASKSASPSPAPADATSADQRERLAIDWVLTEGGTVELHDLSQVFNSKHRPPVGPLRVAHINLETARMSAEDLARLADISGPFMLTTPRELVAEHVSRVVGKLTNISTLTFINAVPAFTPQMADDLADAPINYLILAGREVQAGSVSPLKRMPQLTNMLLKQCQVSRDVFQEINELPRLTALNLESSTVTDDDLAVLTLPRLTFLGLYGCEVTARGLAAFQRRHPQLGIGGIDQWQTELERLLQEMPPPPTEQVLEGASLTLNSAKPPLGPLAPDADGWFTATPADVNSAAVVVIEPVWAKDVVISAKVLHGKGPGNTSMSLRGDNEDRAYIGSISEEHQNVAIILHRDADNSFTVLKTEPLPAANPDGTYDMEFSAQGDLLQVRINGQVACQAKGSRDRQPGIVMIGSYQSAAKFRDIRVRVRDVPNRDELEQQLLDWINADESKIGTVLGTVHGQPDSFAPRIRTVAELRAMPLIRLNLLLPENARDSDLDILRTLGRFQGVDEYAVSLSHSPHLTNDAIFRLTRLPRLRGLILVNSPKLKVSELTRLGAGLKELSWLTVGGGTPDNTPIMDDQDLAMLVERCPKLIILELTNTRVTDAGLQVLFKLNRLERLIVHRSPVERSTIDALRQKFPYALLEWDGGKLTPLPAPAEPGEK